VAAEHDEVLTGLVGRKSRQLATHEAVVRKLLVPVLPQLAAAPVKRLLAQIEEKIAAEEAKENALALPAGQVIDGKSERVPE